MSSAYKQAVICYLDILGYKNWIQSLGDHGPAVIKEIIRSTLEQHRRLYKTVSIKVLSDSILIWSEPASPVAFWDVLNIAGLISDYLLGRGKMVRGGITVGKNFIQDDVLISPAFIEAYQLEQKAKVARVLISPEAYELGFSAIQKTKNLSFIPVVENGRSSRRLVMPGFVSINAEKEIAMRPFCSRTGLSLLTDGVDTGNMPGDQPNTTRSCAEEAIANLQVVRRDLISIGQDIVGKLEVEKKLNYLITEFNQLIDHPEVKGHLVPIQPIGN